MRRNIRVLCLGYDLPTCFRELRDKTRTGRECDRQDEGTLYTFVLVLCCLDENVNQALGVEIKATWQMDKNFPLEDLQH